LPDLFYKRSKYHISHHSLIHSLKKMNYEVQFIQTFFLFNRRATNLTGVHPDKHLAEISAANLTMVYPVKYR
jgi:hypothetical protein